MDYRVFIFVYWDMDLFFVYIISVSAYMLSVQVVLLCGTCWIVIGRELLWGEIYIVP